MKERYRLQKTKMIDEDVNLDVIHIKVQNFKHFSPYQNYIYSFIEDYRNMLIAEETKREIMATASVNPPFSIAAGTPITGGGGGTPISSYQNDKDSNASRNLMNSNISNNFNNVINNSKLLTSDYDVIEFKARSFSNTSNGTSKVSQINRPLDDQYDQRVSEIAKYMRICSDNKFEVKEASLIHMLNYIFYYRPCNKQYDFTQLKEIVECFEIYVANLLISELSNYEKCEDSRYAHLFPDGMPNREINGQYSDHSNNNLNNSVQGDSSFENNNTDNNTNGKQSIAFDFIQQETLWEYISFYANYTFSKQGNSNPVDTEMLSKMIYSILQLSFYKFKTQEQTKIRRSTLELIENIFLDKYLKEELMQQNNFILLRYLLLIQFRNRGFMQDDKQCWWQITDKDMRTELFERVLISTQNHIFTKEDRQQFIKEVKYQLNISNDDDIFYPCISNEDYCALYTPKEIEDNIQKLLNSKQENQIIQYQYYTIKFILNNQNEKFLAQIISRSFNNRKDINKRTIQMIFNEMKAENAKYCLKLLYVVYKNIFKKNEWQDKKHSLFLSYPFYLMKQLDKIEEQETLQKIRQSYFKRSNNYSKRNEDEQIYRNQQSSSHLQQSRFKKNMYQVQTKFKESQSSLPYLVEVASLSKYNPVSKLQQNQQRNILFLLRLGYTIIEQRHKIIDDVKFESLYYSNSVSDYLPFGEGNESNSQFLFFNEFFDMILKIIERYRMIDNNKIILLEISKLIGYLNQINENAFSIKEFPILLSQIKYYDEQVQNNLLDLIVSMSLENGNIYYKLVEENFIKDNVSQQNNLGKLKFNIDTYERKFDIVKNIRIKIPYAFQFIFKLINNRGLTRETILVFLCLLKRISKLEYNQVTLQCCINSILKIVKQNYDAEIQKLLFTILEQLTLHMNVSTLSKMMKFFRPKDKKSLFNEKDNTDDDISNSFSMIPQSAMQNISSITSESKGQENETNSENLKNNYLEILTLLKKLCNRNLQNAYTNNTCYLDFSNRSFVRASNLGQFSNDNFSFIITFRLHEFEDNVQDVQKQYILKIESNKGDHITSSLEILIEKSNRDNNYGICIRQRESDMSTNSRLSNQQSSIINEDNSIKQQDFFKVDLESNKWYLLGICFTNKPPNNNYQAGRVNYYFYFQFYNFLTKYSTVLRLEIFNTFQDIKYIKLFVKNLLLKNQFYLFLNGNHVFYSGTNKFDLQKIKNMDNLCLGNDESQESGLQGQISNFFMSSSFMEGKDIFQMFQFYQEGRISNYPNYFVHIPFVLQLNVSAFQNKELISTQEVNNGLECLEKEKQVGGSFFSKFKINNSQKQTKQTKFVSVQSGGNLFFIQKMTLVEACLQVGNIDIFLFIIQLVAKDQDFTPKQSNEIVADIFNLLSEFYLRYREYLETLEKQRFENFESRECEKFMDFNDDLKIFLQDDGFRIMSQLLYDFISMKGSEVLLVQCLARFLETLKPQQELFYQGIHEVIMNMELWCLANKKIQEKVLEWVLQNLKQQPQLKKYLIEKEYFYRIFLLQNTMMFHSEKVDEQEYMRNRLNEILLLLISQSEADKSGETFKKQIDIFYQFFIFTMYDHKLSKFKLKRLNEFLDMFERILKSPKLTIDNLTKLTYIKFDVNSDLNNSSFKGLQEVSVINIWQTILKQINEQKISFDIQQNQFNQQIITKILKNLKRILEVKERLQAKLENSQGKSLFFFQDLEKIMLELSNMLFCNENTHEQWYTKKNQNLSNRYSNSQQSPNERQAQYKYLTNIKFELIYLKNNSQYGSAGRESGEQSTKNRDTISRNTGYYQANDSYYTSDYRDEKENQEQLYIEILSQCINYDHSSMRLSLLLKILETNLERLDKSPREKLINLYITRSDTPQMLKSVQFYPDFVKFLSKLMKIDTNCFSQISAKYLAYKLSNELDDFLQTLLSHEINSEIYTVLSFLDEGLKIILHSQLPEKYGAFIRQEGDENTEERKVYCIFRFTSILEDLFILKSSIIMKPISTFISKRVSTTMCNTESSRTSLSYLSESNFNHHSNEIRLNVGQNNFGSPENYSYGNQLPLQQLNLPFTQNNQQIQSNNNYAHLMGQSQDNYPNFIQEEEFLKQKQNSTIFLSIFSQCFEFLQDSSIIYSTIPHLMTQKEKIKILDNESSLFQGILGLKASQSNDNSKENKGNNRNSKESKGTLTPNLNLIYDAYGLSKPLSKKNNQLGTQVKAGGLMRIVPNLIFNFMKRSQFQEDFIQSLKLLEAFIFDLKPNSELIGEQNVKFLQNRFINFALIQDKEDIMQHNIRQYLFCSLLHLIKNLRQRLYNNNNTNTTSGVSYNFKSFHTPVLQSAAQSDFTPSVERLTTIQEVNSIYSSQQLYNRLLLNTQTSQNSNMEKTPRISGFSQKPSLDSQQSFPFSRGFSCEQDLEDRQIRGVGSSTSNQPPKVSLEKIPEAHFEEQLNKIKINELNDQEQLLNIETDDLVIEEFQDQEFSAQNQRSKKREHIQYQSFGGSQGIGQQNNVSLIETEKKKQDMHLLSPNLLRKKSDSILQSKLSDQGSLIQSAESNNTQIRNSDLRKRSSKIYEEDSSKVAETEQAKKQIEQANQENDQESSESQQGTEQFNVKYITNSKQQQQQSTAMSISKQNSIEFDRARDKMITSSHSLEQSSSMCFSPLVVQQKENGQPEKILKNNKEIPAQQINVNTPQNNILGFNDSFNQILSKQMSGSTSNTRTNIQASNQINTNQLNNFNEISFNNIARSKSISIEGVDGDLLSHQGKSSSQQRQLIHQQGQINQIIQPMRLNLAYSVSSQDNGQSCNQNHNQNTPRLCPLGSSSDLPSNLCQSHISNKDLTQPLDQLNEINDSLDKDIQQIKPLRELLFFLCEFIIENGSYLRRKFKQAIIIQQQLSDANLSQKNQTFQKMNSIHSDYSYEGGNSSSSQQHLMPYQVDEKPKVTGIKEKLKKIEKGINEKVKALQIFSQISQTTQSASRDRESNIFDKLYLSQANLNEEYQSCQQSVDALYSICRDAQSTHFQILNSLNQFLKKDQFICSKKLIEVLHKDCYYQIKLVQRIRQYQLEKIPSTKTTPKISSSKLAKEFDALFVKVTDQCLQSIKYKHKDETWLQNKVVSKWDSQLKNMVSQKGIWYQREKQYGEVFYKLRRYQDEFGRRFFICPDLSKENGFYSPSKKSKNNFNNNNNPSNKSVLIPSLECLDQQQQQFVQRQSLQPSKYQNKQINDYTDSIISQQNSEGEGDVQGIKVQDDIQENNEIYHQRDAFRLKPQQIRKQSYSDNKLSDVKSNSSHQLTEQSPEFKKNESTKYFEQSNSSYNKDSQNSSQLRGLFGTNNIVHSPHQDKIQFQRRNAKCSNNEEDKYDQQNEFLNNGQKSQSRIQFQRSPKRKSMTVADTNFINHQESIKKFLEQKYRPTQEQIEQSEVTPKRPVGNKQNEETLSQFKIPINRQIPQQIKSPLSNENLKVECEYITLKCTYYGQLQINEESIQFLAYENKQRPTEHLYTLYGSHIDSLVNKKLKKKLQIVDILSIHSRRFNMKEIAIEIFTNNSKSYYFNLYKQRSRDIFFEKMEQLKQMYQNVIDKLQKVTYSHDQNYLNNPHHRHGSSSSSSDSSSQGNKQQNSNFQTDLNNYHSKTKEENAKKLHYAEKINNIELITNRVEYFKQKRFTEKWKKGEISNFDYLMLVNQFSSRSFNDITQYPVFPWIFNRYNNQDLEINNPSHYRDLSKPVGALNPQRLIDFKERYESSYSNEFSTAYFYSSHYSSQAFVYNYLIRLEPFTKLHFDFMAQKFDCAQRLFYSIPNTWFSCLNNANDLRELVPEFFYLPEFLKSKPHLQLGNLPNGKSINSVELPNWAQNPEHFIALHRKGLESPYVSRNLGKWIDLIFGVKLRSFEDNNIFPDCCYQEHIFNKISQSDTVQQIIQMSMSILVGQCPSQLFYQAHEQKNIQIEEDISQLPFQFKEQELEGPSKNKTIIGFNLIGKNIYIYDTTNQIYSIRTNDLMKNFNRRVFKDKNIQNEYEFKERGINTNYQMNNIIYSFNEQIMLVSGFQDSSFRMYKDLKQIQKIHYHKKPISMIRGSDKHNLIFCASEDLRISVWDIQKENSYKLYHLFYIYGHNQQINTICLSDLQKIIFSTDKDRICLIHSYKGKFLNNFVMRNLEQNDYATLSSFSPDSSQILIASHLNKIQLYKQDFYRGLNNIFTIYLLYQSLNGELLFDYCQKSIPNSILQIDFFLETSLNGQLNILHDYQKYISNKHQGNDSQQYLFKSIATQSQNKDPITAFINLPDKSDYDILCITKKGYFKAFKKFIDKSK